MEKKFEIKITDSGTAKEIGEALRLVADRIYHPTSMGHDKNLNIDNVEWEDATLMTEINEQ